VTYTLAASVGVLAAVGFDLLVLRTRVLFTRVFWVSYVIVFGFQLLFNGILTSRGVVRYAPEAILGPRLVSAPVEDLAFGFALVVLSLSLWVWWEGRVRADP